MSRFLNFILILVGASIAIYAQAEEQQNQYILIIGIAVLMFGLFRLSSRIPSKHVNDSSIIDEEE